jgi:hypothetical protein
MERIFNKKDCGLFICHTGLKKYFRKSNLYKLVDVQQGGTLLTVADRKGKVVDVPPLCFRQHFIKLSVWKGPNGMELEVLGDPREYEDTEMRLVAANGTVLAQWVQNWTEFDESGKKCHYGHYAPWTRLFLSDITDAGCQDIPSDVDLMEFKHHRMKANEW